MKPILIIPLLFLSVVFCQKEYNITHITEQNGVYTKKFSDEIVNGRVFQMYGDMKVSLGKMKNGKKDGKWTLWHDNGQKKYEGTYKDGEKDGKWTWWYENSQFRTQKSNEWNYKDGKLISSKSWDEYGWRKYYPNKRPPFD